MEPHCHSGMCHVNPSLLTSEEPPDRPFLRHRLSLSKPKGLKRLERGFGNSAVLFSETPDGLGDQERARSGSRDFWNSLDELANDT